VVTLQVRYLNKIINRIQIQENILKNDNKCTSNSVVVYANNVI
jgi:hypothetical protein